MVTLGHLLYNRPADPDDRDHLQKWSHWVILFATGRLIQMKEIICKIMLHPLCNWPPHMDEWIISKRYGCHLLSSLKEKKRNEDVELPGRTACY